MAKVACPRKENAARKIAKLKAQASWHLLARRVNSTGKNKCDDADSLDARSGEKLYYHSTQPSTVIDIWFNQESKEKKFKVDASRKMRRLTNVFLVPFLTIYNTQCLDVQKAYQSKRLNANICPKDFGLKWKKPTSVYRGVTLMQLM